MQNCGASSRHVSAEHLSIHVVPKVQLAVGCLQFFITLAPTPWLDKCKS